MYRENAAFISITLKLPLCKSEKLNAQHGVPHGQRSMFKKRKERRGDEGMRVQTHWHLLLPPLGQCLGPMGAELGTQDLQQLGWIAPFLSLRHQLLLKK